MVAAGTRVNGHEPHAHTRQSAAAEAFQRTLAAIDTWPTDTPMTGWDLRMITTRVRH